MSSSLHKTLYIHICQSLSIRKDMYSADHRETILLIPRLIRVATIHGLVVFAIVFCGRINLPEDPSLWSPKATTPGHPGHNAGQVETSLRVKDTNSNATRTTAVLDSVRSSEDHFQGTTHYYSTPLPLLISTMYSHC